MYLIADSGSTKCDWALLQDGKDPVRFQTAGFNPFYFTKESLSKAIANADALKSVVGLPVHLRFFGAGCSDDIQNTKVLYALQANFIQPKSIHVQHDMMGAALATCGDQSGICCILGTGSNACYYDGQDIRQNTPSLGLYLGDEGSGGYLGKELVRKFFYKQLPEDLHQAFAAEHNLQKDTFLDRIYSQPKPNTFLAGFFPFLVKHKHHAFVRDMIRQGFTDFIVNHVLAYPEAKETSVHFIGSVGFLFQDLLEEVLQSKQLSMGKVLQTPMEGMIENVPQMTSI